MRASQLARLDERVATAIAAQPAQRRRSGLGSTGFRSRPVIVLLALVSAVTMAAGGIQVLFPVGSSASGGPVYPPDACQTFFASRLDRFPTALRGGPIGADLVARFPAINLTCNATEADGVSQVRGVFAELADETGTVAVAVVLGSSQSDMDYRTYLVETFQGATIDFEYTDLATQRSLIGWVREHPRVEEARRLHRESTRHVDLSDLSGSLASRSAP